jgi:uncharacterized protein (TIGR02118 family)
MLRRAFALPTMATQSSRRNRVPERLKKIAFLVPRPGMTDAAFRTYWRDTHGPVVAGSPGYAAWRLRYAQNHVLGPGPIGEAFGFAGMAEFWLPGASPNEDTFAATPIYRDRIRVDELNFIDMGRTISMTAREEVVKPGSGAAKLVVLSARAQGLAAKDLRARYSQLARQALGQQGFGRHVAAWTASHVVEGTYRLPGGRAAEAIAVDCIEEFWFASPGDLDQAFASENWQHEVGPAMAALFGTRQSFTAEEIVFFDVLGT